MIPLQKKIIDFKLPISKDQLNQKIKKSPKIEFIKGYKKGGKYKLMRDFGNSGVIRMFWSKISVIYKIKRTQELKIIYKLDGVSFFMFFMLMIALVFQFLLPKDKFPRDYPEYAVPLMCLIYFALLFLEFKRVKKVTNNFFDK